MGSNTETDGSVVEQQSERAKAEIRLEKQDVDGVCVCGGCKTGTAAVEGAKILANTLLLLMQLLLDLLPMEVVVVVKHVAACVTGFSGNSVSKLQRQLGKNYIPF